MKRFFLIFIIVTGFAYVGVAQNHIVEPWKRWANLHEYCHPEGTVYTTDYIRFGGDTVVEGITYKKVLQSEDEEHQNWIFYGYFIREQNDSVFLRRPFEQEGLIYDFSLQQAGDTVTINNPATTSSLHLTLDAVDSVQTSGGWRKRWKLVADGYENPEYWIEGIGSMSGVLNSGMAVFGGLCGSADLLCEHEHDTLVYQNPEYGSCYIITTSINKAEKELPLRITYVPASGLFRFDFEKSGNIVRFYNIGGQLIKSVETRNPHCVIPAPSNYRGKLLLITVTDGFFRKTVKTVLR